MTNETVKRSKLDFEPSLPWVYYCNACDEYIDVEDMEQHIDDNRGGDHGVVTHIERRDVI